MIDFAAIEAVNAALGAFVDIDLQAKFGDGALAGITIGVKANIQVAGLPWTGGMAAYRRRTSVRDADCVARLRDAGAAIIGTLNMEEAALGATTDNPWFGATQNPHRIGHTPGGSSGGSGAAVAAGLCDAALGTDTMGSVRIPAAYCGVYGFKPANAAVGQDGLEIADADLDCIGPLARSIDLLERVARIMSDFGEGGAAQAITMADWGDVDCDAGVPALVGAAVSALGASTSGRVLGEPLSRIRYAGFVKTTRSLAAHLAGVDQEMLSAPLRRLIAYGTRRSDDDWAEDRAILADTRSRLCAAVSGGAIILLPTAPQAAFPHGDPVPANQADFTCLANIAGLPAVSIPAGWSAKAMPLGVQLMTAAGHEAGLFAAARTLDAQFAAYRPPAHFLKGAIR